MKANSETSIHPDDLTFQVRPRLLTLLGEQLIRDANVAVFELVKNAYDADATQCSVTLNHPDDLKEGSIIIEDDGSGMSEATLRNVWMMIGTDYRAKQRKKNKRTTTFGRYPLGEKGLGRLSIHKLGRHVRLVTRRRSGEELVLNFDWDLLESADELGKAAVRLHRRKPTTFTGDNHGTRLEVTKLREVWARGELRRLHRAINSLCSPFKAPGDFEVSLAAPGREEWLDGLLLAEDVEMCALYHVRGQFQGNVARFDYEFKPPKSIGKKLTVRRVKVRGLRLEGKEGRKAVPVDLSALKIGNVEFSFWLFDRDPAVLRAVTDDVMGLKEYLNDNGGIRIYRDGIRVYDFGEPGNDWLNLDLRRVNTPTAKTSNNQILGALRLDAVQSSGLREKTNREGFIENAAYAAFRDAVISVLTNVEAEKSKDQKRLREAFGKGTGQKIFAKLTALRETLEEQGVLQAVEPRLKEVEKEMEIYRDQLLHAAVPGLTIGIMLHGAEKILEELRVAAQKGDNVTRIRDLVDRLYRSMRPVTNLLKNPGVAKTKASVLIAEAKFSTELRLKRHEIRLMDNCDFDFMVQGSKQMLIASITNLIDNAIHWLDVRNPSNKIVYLSTEQDLDGGPAIVVADNGPGYGDDDPEDLIAPFFSRRSGGMGLGLYIVDEVMRVNNGRLIFPAHGDIELPRQLDGAVVALQFPEAS